MVADASNDDPARHVRFALRAAAGAVTAIDAVLPSAFENGMLGDDGSEIEDTDQVGQLLDLDDPASSKHAVSTASKRCRGSVCSSGCSAANASATTRWVVP